MMEGIEDVSVPLTVSSSSTRAVVLDVSDASSNNDQERKVKRVREESAEITDRRGMGSSASSSHGVRPAPELGSMAMVPAHSYGPVQSVRRGASSPYQEARGRTMVRGSDAVQSANAPPLMPTTVVAQASGPQVLSVLPRSVIAGQTSRAFL